MSFRNVSNWSDTGGSDVLTPFEPHGGGPDGDGVAGLQHLGAGDRYAIYFGAVGATHVAHLVFGRPEVPGDAQGQANLGVVAADVGIGEHQTGVREASDDQRLGPELHPVTV